MTVLLDATAVPALLQAEPGAQVIRPLLGESSVLSVNLSDRLDVTVYTADGEFALFDSTVRVELIR